MSDSDDSAVLVDTPTTEDTTAPDLMEEPTTPTNNKDDLPGVEVEMTEVSTLNNNTNGPRAVQIVQIGDSESKYAFRFDHTEMDAILKQIPDDARVAVVSVVGAFRTGKSFLLSWFLRYLESHGSDNSEEEDEDTTTTPPSQSCWYQKFQSLGNDGFDWRAGSERNTTGIWMWNRPYLLKNNNNNNNKIAILLVDTQGMFDHETTMALTASIFGFSTLLSSYQIYNVDKRIQEDNLQHLALFSEYARMAVTIDDEQQQQQSKPIEQNQNKPEKTSNSINDTKIPGKHDFASQNTIPNKRDQKPFQLIEFLVRDWQHFDEDAEQNENYSAMETSMESYLESVIAERDAKDLRETREQILGCFETISCYALCHPGAAVTKKKYNGDVHAMEKTFLNLLVRYCSRVFGDLQPKIIHGRELTAKELGVFVQAYADLFSSGAKFPTAGTMLEATANANNTNAIHMALQSYKTAMDRISGPLASNYLRPEELREEEHLCRLQSLRAFQEMATFGSQKAIAAAKEELSIEIANRFQMYQSLNESRNPLAGMEL
jgi:atlastin